MQPKQMEMENTEITIENKKLLAALNYAEKLGFSVIPVGNDKKPLIKWEAYQKQKASPEEIKDWWSKWPDANIGIVTGMISNLAVVDIDTQEGKEAIQEFIPDSLLMPTCTTPRGGQHLYFTCPDDKLSNNARVVPGCDLRANGGYVVAPPSRNGTGNSYSFLKGLSPFEIDWPALPQAYLSFLKNACINNSICIKENVTDSVTLFSLGRRDNDLFHIANQLAKAKTSESEIRQVLEILAKNCTPPFPEKEINIKIESALKRVERREINITDMVERWISVTDGDFSVTDAVQAVQTVTSVTNRDTVRQVLKRLKDQGKIVKSGRKDGIYRRIDEVITEIDFLSASTDAFNIKWPFQIEKRVKTHPKNIIVVAGSYNAGKTAFLLNTVVMNMHKFKINYFSSEMGPVELKERLSKFEIPIKDFKKVKWFERSGNFADVIKPDEVNIIDFLEMTDNFYLIAQYIKEIFDKLITGIAIIAIQKNPGQALGLGGGRSIEKARLYLSMDAGRLKIEKGKNWTNQAINPNGLEITFKLVQGCKFICTDKWYQKSEQIKTT